MRDHAVWSLSDSQFKVWITILTLANHRDGDWWNGRERVTIPAGSFITSQDHLAKESNTSRKTVRLAIAALIQIGSIKANTRANKYTEVCLVNSERYRGSDVEEGQQEGQLGANQGPTEGQLGATTGECKKEEKERSTYTPAYNGYGTWPEEWHAIRELIKGTGALPFLARYANWLHDLDWWQTMRTVFKSCPSPLESLLTDAVGFIQSEDYTARTKKGLRQKLRNCMEFAAKKRERGQPSLPMASKYPRL